MHVVVFLHFVIIATCSMSALCPSLRERNSTYYHFYFEYCNIAMFSKHLQPTTSTIHSFNKNKFAFYSDYIIFQNSIIFLPKVCLFMFSYNNTQITQIIVENLFTAPVIPLTT